MNPLEEIWRQDIQTIENHIKEHRCVQEFHYFRLIPSTQEFARQHWRHLRDRTLILAGHQTHGKGRFSRTWFSPPLTGFYGTFFYVAKHNDEQKFWFFATSLALLSTIKMFVAEAYIRFPNDIYAQEKKLAGILTEALIYGSHVRAILVGTGVNLRRHPILELKNLSYRTLEDLGWDNPSIREFTLTFIHHVNEFLIRDKRRMTSRLLQEWINQVNPGKDTIVRFFIDGREETGVLVDITHDGEARIRAHGVDYTRPIWEVSLV